MGIKNCLKFVTRDIVKNCQNAKATYVCYSIHLSLDIFLFVELFSFKISFNDIWTFQLFHFHWWSFVLTGLIYCVKRTNEVFEPLIKIHLQREERGKHCQAPVKVHSWTRGGPMLFSLCQVIAKESLKHQTLLPWSSFEYTFNTKHIKLIIPIEAWYWKAYELVLYLTDRDIKIIQRGNETR